MRGCTCFSFPSSPPIFSFYGNSNSRFSSSSSSSSSLLFSSASHHCSVKLSPLLFAKSTRFRTNCKAKDPEVVDCVGTGLDVECLVSQNEKQDLEIEDVEKAASNILLEWAVLVSPFFFWGTAMVAMKEVLPKAGPFFVASFRLIPAGLLLVAFANSKGKPLPSGLTAWLSIALFALVDAACFQGFLAQGLQRTSAGLGSVIIDSQPLTVAVLASFLFNESIGLVGAAGLVLGVVGLLLLEHMIIGGLPLLGISILNHDPVFSGSFQELSASDLLALFYTSIFGSAISYGVFFYSATKGSLTKLSSLTFLTPMFASIFG
ncbi:hypothetical protein ES288_A12G057400v1 [Gossypium darwinii]|nr:hypothetical protein ES288_A12G057400v1 [Gossypium darwinii]